MSLYEVLPLAIFRSVIKFIVLEALVILYSIVIVDAFVDVDSIDSIVVFFINTLQY